MNYDQNLVNISTEERSSNPEVDTTAFLVLTDNHVGVTNALEDIAAYIKENLKDGEGMFIKKGYKDEMLALEQKILTLDNLIYASNNTLLVPHKQKDFNLVKRNSSSKTPLTVVDIIKPYK